MEEKDLTPPQIAQKTAPHCRANPARADAAEPPNPVSETRVQSGDQCPPASRNENGYPLPGRRSIQDGHQPANTACLLEPNVPHHPYRTPDVPILNSDTTGPSPGHGHLPTPPSGRITRRPTFRRASVWDGKARSTSSSTPRELDGGERITLAPRPGRELRHRVLESFGVAGERW